MEPHQAFWERDTLDFDCADKQSSGRVNERLNSDTLVQQQKGAGLLDSACKPQNSRIITQMQHQP